MAETTQMAKKNWIKVETADGRIIDAPEEAVRLHNEGDSEPLIAFMTQYYIDNPAPSSSTAPPPPAPARDNMMMRRVSEGLSSFNRTMGGIADIATAPIQAAESQVRPYVQAMMGYRKTQPTGDFFSSLSPERGAFAGDDFWGKVAAGAGEMTAYMIPTGAGFRLTAKALTEIPTLNPSNLRRILMEMGKVTPRTDVQIGLQSGAGGSVLGQLAEDINIPGTDIPLEPLARLTGEIISPVAWSATANKLLSVGRNYIIAGARSPSLLPNKAIPSIEELRGLKNAQYQLLDEAGFALDGPSVGKLRNDLNTFTVENNIAPATDTGALATKINQILKAADESRVSYSFLDDVISSLKDLGSGTDTTAFRARQLAQILDDRLLNVTLQSTSPIVASINVGEVLTQARGLNRRLSNASLIEDIFKNAETHMLKTGKNTSAEYNQYIRDNLQPLLLTRNAPGYNNAARFLTEADKEAIQKALNRDGGLEGALNLIQRAGFNSDDFVKLQFIGTGVGLGTGLYTGTIAPLQAAGLGAVILGNTALAKVAEVMAAKLMRFNAGLAKQMIAAGDNGADIIKAYYRNTTRGQRKPEELSALLINNHANPEQIRRGTNFAKIPFVNNSLALAVAAQEIISKEETAAETQRLIDQKLIPPD